MDPFVGPHMPHRSLTFASLFSGCGGFDLGFIERGFQPVGAFDWDPDAVQNYRLNFDTIVRLADLRLGIPNEEAILGVDVLIAGPPCQGFSTAGRRRFDDERNHFLPLTAQLALRVKPRVLIVENVPGALAGQHSSYWFTLDRMMRDAGYRTKTLRCQAVDLGMAQLRRRVLLIAWKTARDIEFDIPAKRPGNLQSVLSGVTKLDDHFPRMLKPESAEWFIANRIKPGQKLCNVRGGINAVATWDIPEVFGEVTENERTLLELLRRLRRQKRQREFGDADPVSYARLKAALGSPFKKLLKALIHKGYVREAQDHVDLVGTFNGKFRRLQWTEPGLTVDTRFGSPRYFLHPSEQRGFTVREAARIQGFPDSFKFEGSEKAQFRLIGNAVPPPLASFAAELTLRLLD